jgi:hypothetical protein
MPKPNTADAMKRFRAGKAGFTDKAHLKAKGLIPRADGTKKKSPQYEDAPANATGTAVAGTGDDSSTVVVKKKKDKDKMKDRLLRRFKIKETIDRLVPDIEPPKDEVRERVDQLKGLALSEAFTSQQIKQAYGILNDPRYKQGNYSGAVKAIEKLARGLSKHPDVANALKRANESLEEKRVAQDKDVKSKPGTQPKKYYKTLSKAEKEKRASHFSKQTYKKSDDDDDYKPAPGDKGAKTKTSKFTKKFKQMYGEVADLNEKIKGLENKAKKTGMPYGILKKVYDRGMAAWKGGHRPGATQQQWAFARVNSFVTKSPGTWGKADKDLAAKVRGSKK